MCFITRSAHNIIIYNKLRCDSQVTDKWQKIPLSLSAAAICSLKMPVLMISDTQTEIFKNCSIKFMLMTYELLEIAFCTFKMPIPDLLFLIHSIEWRKKNNYHNIFCISCSYLVGNISQMKNKFIYFYDFGAVDFSLLVVSKNDKIKWKIHRNWDKTNETAELNTFE